MPLDTSGPAWSVPIRTPLNLNNWTREASVNVLASLAGLDPSIQVGYRDLPPGAYDAINSTEPLLAPAGGVTLVYPAGSILRGIYADITTLAATSLVVTLDAHLSPAAPNWEIQFPAGSILATNTTPLGWNVVYINPGDPGDISGREYTITIPGGATPSTALAYGFRITPSYFSLLGGGGAFVSDSGHFDVA